MGFDITGIGSIADALKPLIDLIPNPNEKMRAAQELQKIDAQIAQAQIAVNAEEAKSANLFVSGWRPFIGWVCGFGFVYTIIQPGLHLPAIDMSNIIGILGGLLGLGTMRTVEKLKGVSK